MSFSSCGSMTQAGRGTPSDGEMGAGESGNVGLGNGDPPPPNIKWTVTSSNTVHIADWTDINAKLSPGRYCRDLVPKWLRDTVDRLVGTVI